MDQPLRVLHIPKDALARRGLRELLAALPAGALRLVSARTPAEAERRIQRGLADLLLAHLDTPGALIPGPRDPLMLLAERVPLLLIAPPEREAAALEALAWGAQDVLVAGRTAPAELLRACRRAVARHRHLAALRDLAFTDELTGLLNRRGFLALARRHLALARRSGREALLLFADVDDLKAINDKFGHGAGDQALRLAARALRESFRSTDVLGRLGGDEFAGMLLDSTPRSVQGLLERLDRRLRELAAENALAFPFSMSRGVDRFDPARPRTLEELLGKADQSMYLDRKDAAGRAAEAT